MRLLEERPGLAQVALQNAQATEAGGGFRVPLAVRLLEERPGPAQVALPFEGNTVLQTAFAASFARALALALALPPASDELSLGRVQLRTSSAPDEFSLG